MFLLKYLLQLRFLAAYPARLALWGRLLLLLLPNTGYAQLQGRITDKATGAPVAFANIQVQHEAMGTTAVENGFFNLDLPVGDALYLVVSAVGYKPAKVKAAASPMAIELEPTVQLLREVIVRKPGKATKRIIGAFKKSDVRSGFGIGSQQASPWIIARYFPYEPEFSQTPYIEQLTLVTRSEIKNAKFRLRLLQVTPAGTPGADLLHVPIIVSAPKGNKSITVTLQEYQVQVPEEGFFIAFEWLLLPENKYYRTYKRADGTSKTTFNYEPTLAAARVASNSRTWIYTGGTWSRSTIRHRDNTFSEPQYKVVLSQ